MRPFTSFILAVTSICSITIAQAKSQGLSNLDKDTRSHNGKTMRQSYDEAILGEIFGFLPTTPSSKHGAHVFFKVSRDGLLKDIQMSKKGDSFEDDFNCLLALKQIYRLPAPPAELNSDFVAFSFINSKDVLASPAEKQTLRKLNTEARSKFFAEHPKSQGKVILYNSLPLTILDQYPGAFSVDEITSPSNLRAINKQAFLVDEQTLSPEAALRNKTLNAIDEIWIAFFNSHKTATKKELLAERDLIDDRFKAFLEAPEKVGDR